MNLPCRGDPSAVLKFLMVLVDFKGYSFKVRKVQFGLLLSIKANISEKVHAVTNVCMKHIYKVIYDLSVDLVIFDLGLPSKVISRSQTFQLVVSHKWCIV